MKVCAKCLKPKPAMEYKGRTRNGDYKTCVSCREYARKRRKATRHNETLRGTPEEVRHMCEYCIYEEYCNTIVFTILPLVCQVELTPEQARVLEVLSE